MKTFEIVTKDERDVLECLFYNTSVHSGNDRLRSINVDGHVAYGLVRRGFVAREKSYRCSWYQLTDDGENLARMILK